jgi:hypothetical protein
MFSKMGVCSCTIPAKMTLARVALPMDTALKGVGTMRHLVKDHRAVPEQSGVTILNKRATWGIGSSNPSAAMRVLHLAIALLVGVELVSAKRKEKVAPVRDWKAGIVTKVGSEVQISRGTTTGNVDQYGNLHANTQDVRRVNYTFTIEAEKTVIDGVQIRHLVRRFPLPRLSDRCGVAIGDSIHFAVDGGMLYIQGRDQGGDCELRITQQTLKSEVPKQ